MRGAFGDDAGVVLSRRLISNNSCVVSKCNEKMSCFWPGSGIVIGPYGAGCTRRRAELYVWGVLHVGGAVSACSAFLRYCQHSLLHNYLSVEHAPSQSLIANWRGTSKCQRRINWAVISAGHFCKDCWGGGVAEVKAGRFWLTAATHPSLYVTFRTRTIHLPSRTPGLTG